MLYFLSIDGDVGVMLGKGGDPAGLMLTETGFVKGSCFGGSLSGGPIGPSSRFFFLFFSNLLLSSDLLLLLFFSLLLSSVEDLLWDGAIGVIVMELGKVAAGDVTIGIISIPGRRSKPIPIPELNP